MKSEKALLRDLTEMSKLTAQGRLKWEIIVSTSEYKDADTKPTVEEDGVNWLVDECYVSYHCTFKGEEFLLITYEMIHSYGEKRKSTNMIFLPPLGVRYFDLHTLLPYSITATQMLTYNIHMLWKLILEQQKKNPDQISIDAFERELTIEEDE